MLDWKIKITDYLLKVPVTPVNARSGFYLASKSQSEGIES